MPTRHEELGIPLDHHITFLYELKERNSIESEDIFVFSAIYNGHFSVQKEELDEIKFWTVCELESELNNDSLTPLCRKELINFFAKE